MTSEETERINAGRDHNGQQMERVRSVCRMKIEGAELRDKWGALPRDLACMFGLHI